MSQTSYVHRTKEFFREYTAGANVDEFQRLFDRDVADAYAVLARDRNETEPEEGLSRWLHRAKVLFLGMSFKLHPARRVIFALSLVFTVIGLIDDDPVRFTGDRWSVEIEFTPLWFLVAIAGLVLVLGMELVDRIRVRDELEVARQLQRDLLPDQVPHVAGYDVAHSYRTANTIGGDYYDLLPLADGRVVVVVGDASGHGIAAGLLMAIANASLKTALDIDPAPAAVLELLNRALVRTGDRRAFMTLFYGLLDPRSGTLDYACAGHPFPIVRRAGGGIEELGSGQLPLGMRAQLDFDASRVELADGDLLMLYSDGLPEAIDAGGHAFGFDRLRSLLEAPGSPQAIHDRVLIAFDQHRGQEPLRDDLTLVVLARHLAPPPPPPGRD